MESSVSAPASIWSGFVDGLVNYLLLSPYRQAHSRLVAQLRLAPGAHVGDFGCGPGNLAWTLARASAGHMLTGLDNNQAVLNRAKLEIRKYRDGLSSARFVAADLNQPADVWGLDPAVPFDGAVWLNNLYTVDDPAFTLGQIAQCLRPHARLAISTPGNNPDMMAVLNEHLALEYPGSDATSCSARLTERGQILELFAGANTAIVGTSRYHFLTQSALMACVDPSLWEVVDYRMGYGTPAQNHELILQRRE